MVRRLVKYQEVRLCQQHIGQCHTLLLATAQLSHSLGKVSNLQLCQHLFGLQHLFVFTLMVKACIKHTFVWVELRRLIQHTQLQVTSEHDATRVVAFLTAEYGKKRRLTRAVLGYQTHLLAFANRKADIAEQRQSAKRLGQVLYIKIGNH